MSLKVLPEIPVSKAGLLMIIVLYGRSGWFWTATALAFPVPPGRDCEVSSPG